MAFKFQCLLVCFGTLYLVPYMLVCFGTLYIYTSRL